MGIDSIQTVGVVGAGQMGGGIAHVAAVVAGRNVIITDVNQELADRGKALIDRFLAKAVAKGKLGEDDRATIIHTYLL